MQSTPLGPGKKRGGVNTEDYSAEETGVSAGGLQARTSIDKAEHKQAETLPTSSSVMTRGVVEASRAQWTFDLQ